MPSTRKKHRPARFWKGWRDVAPGYKDRRVMYGVCGKQCFLQPPYKYPICRARTCRIDRRGVMSGYIRARQRHNWRTSAKARRMLDRLP